MFIKGQPRKRPDQHAAVRLFIRVSDHKPEPTSQTSSPSLFPFGQLLHDGLDLLGWLSLLSLLLLLLLLLRLSRWLLLAIPRAGKEGCQARSTSKGRIGRERGIGIRLRLRLRLRLCLWVSLLGSLLGRLLSRCATEEAC